MSSFLVRCALCILHCALSTVHYALSIVHSSSSVLRPSLSIVLLLGLTVTACGGDDATPTPPPPVVPTALVARPTATRPPAPATNASIPTAAPLSNANGLPPNTCPFTGLPLNGIDLAARRPLLVKLGNSAPERPQSGLAQADVVVEHLTEGAITRFAALFYCSDAAEIGPIRSARLIDLELVPMFGAIFAHVGGSQPVRAMIAASDIAEGDFDDYGRAPIFREITARKRPFNRYTSSREMYDLARQENLITGAPVPAFRFASAIPPGGSAAASVIVPYRKNVSDAVFTYDDAQALYLRSTGTTPQRDAASNQPLTAANVLILYTPHETTDIVEDSLGSRSIKITLTGAGKGILVRDGQEFNVTWSRSDSRTLWQFTGANGSPIALKPGKTWIEIVPPEIKVTVEE